MTKAPDFKKPLTRVIEPTGGPSALLETIEDAARFIGLMQPWRQARPHWDFSALGLRCGTDDEGRENRKKKGC
jgi:hypothetical protein